MRKFLLLVAGLSFGAISSTQSAEINANKNGGQTQITLNLRNVSLLDAIRYITEVSGLHYQIDGNAVVISKQKYSNKPIIRKIYPVNPSIVSKLPLERQGFKRFDIE